MPADFGDLRNLDQAHTKTHFSAHPYRSAAEWNGRRAELRQQILASAGLLPLPPKTPLLAQRSARQEHDGYAVEKVVLQPLLGFFLAGNLYTPLHRGPRAAAVLIAHGHWKHGRAHQAEDYSVPALAANLARQGFVAFAHDMVGYNDTRQLRHDFGDSAEERRWAFSPLGLQLWNCIRALDFLQSLPEVDPRRLAVTGASGGGTQTILLAAVEDRIRVSVPVDMVSANFQGDDACEMAPGLRIGTNNVEIAALVAPRPMMLVSSTKDWTKHTPDEEFPAIRSIYHLYGAQDRVTLHHVDAPHNYNHASRAGVYAFLHRHLRARMPGVDKMQERPTQLPPEALLLDEPIKPGSAVGGQVAGGPKEIFEQWKTMAQLQVQELPRETLREALRATIGAQWPRHVTSYNVGNRQVLERDGAGERIPARWLNGPGEGTTVVATRSGAESGAALKLAGLWLSRSSRLLLIDVYQTGQAVTAREPLRGDHLTFHRSDDAARVQDIMTALAAAATDRGQPVTLVCDQDSYWWCATATALAPVPVTLGGTVTGTDVGSADWTQHLAIPGLVRLGGWASIRRLLPRPDAARPPDSPPSLIDY